MLSALESSGHCITYQTRKKILIQYLVLIDGTLVIVLSLEIGKLVFKLEAHLPQTHFLVWVDVYLLHSTYFIVTQDLFLLSFHIYFTQIYTFFFGSGHFYMRSLNIQR